MSKSPTAIDWSIAYMHDSDTDAIFKHLIHDAKASWSYSELSKLHPEYRSNVKHKRIKILHDKLALVKPKFQYK